MVRNGKPSIYYTIEHTFFDHSHGETLLEATELAAIASPLVNRTVLLSKTNVLGRLLNSSLKETLAPFTSANTIVLTGSIIGADGARQDGIW